MLDQELKYWWCKWCWKTMILYFWNFKTYINLSGEIVQFTKYSCIVLNILYLKRATTWLAAIIIHCHNHLNVDSGIGQPLFVSNLSSLIYGMIFHFPSRSVWCILLVISNFFYYLQQLTGHFAIGFWKRSSFKRSHVQFCDDDGLFIHQLSSWSFTVCQQP
jgi:hypothetical protein